jgi:hypothetical protein
MTPAQDHNAAPIIGGKRIVLGTPRKLPKAHNLDGRVVVLDIAFASASGGRKKAFTKTTLKLIRQLDDRLAMWVDHHDSEHHADFRDDPRFVLATKAEHGACPEMVSPELVARAGRVDTIVCHNDFDGLATAAKWILGGEEPYPGCDDDARAVDTRKGLPGEVGARFDRALRARHRDTELQLAVVRQLVSRLADEEAWRRIDEAGAELAPREAQARTLAEGYRALTDELMIVDATDSSPYDRTLLLLLGQERTRMAAVIDGDNITFAAPYDSGVNFLDRFGLSGGMPTCVSVHRGQLEEALTSLGVQEREAAKLAS